MGYPAYGEGPNWEPDGVTHQVRFYEGGGTYRQGFPPLLSPRACLRKMAALASRRPGAIHRPTGVAQQAAQIAAVLRVQGGRCRNCSPQRRQNVSFGRRNRH